MRNIFYTTCFGLGALVLLWVAAGFVQSNALALAMTVLIAAVYGLGTLELQQFRKATDGLSAALAKVPQELNALGTWLKEVPPPLQNTVRLRIEGERIGLPGPALTPYLLGLLVMLGMLGTFLGMVVALNGAVFAMEGTTDLQAIRTAFSTPIKGLGLAFGTSVAGVAASAMLGLMSALSRRERLLTLQTLDGHIATSLKHFSLTHQRQQSYQALQLQAQALPAVVAQMQSLMAQIEQMNQQLNLRLLANQEGFHAQAKEVYSGLASAVGTSLQDSLARSAQVAGDSLKPVLEQAMRGIAHNASQMHERMVQTTQQQLDGLAARFQASASSVSEGWMQSLETMATTLSREWQQAGTHTLAQQQEISNALRNSVQQISGDAQSQGRQTLEHISRMLAASEELVRSRMASEAQWTQQHGARMQQFTAVLQTELAALRTEEAQRGQAAVDRLADLQTALTAHLGTLGAALEAPITRLIETASEAPRAAAEVIGKLREEVSNSMARDNALLDERSRILGTLNGLLESINQASLEQRGVIDTLVASSAVALQAASSQFAEEVGAQTAGLADMAAQVSSSAVEVSTLGETLGFAVKSFSDANDKLIANLQRIESGMDKSMARSDEQLAYYVAQAREVIDLSILSQKEVVDALRQLPVQPAVRQAQAA